jgi:hypothetical protein
MSSSRTFTCGEREALIGYLYDECEVDEREAVETHLAQCAACAQEAAALGATRRILAAWHPPEAALGFRLTRDHAVPPAGARAARWWQQPLPAWAQAAAAVAIFAAGLFIGTVRVVPSAGSAAGTSERPAAPATAARHEQLAAPAAGVSPADLAALEQRLRAEIAQVRAAAGSPVRVDAAAVSRIVAPMIADSEERQRRELAYRTAELIADFELQRRQDMAQVRQAIGQFQGVTGREVQQHREALNYLMRNISLAPNSVSR